MTASHFRIGSTSTPTPTKLEAALKAFPLFGGEDENKGGAATTTTTTQETAGATTETKKNDPTVGPTTTTTQNGSETDQRIAQLLTQAEQAANELKAAKAEIDGFKQKETEAQRATQTREQNLTNDLDKANQTIAQMDAVIRHSALINAVSSLKDYEFHSVRHVINELQDNEFDIDIDLEKGQATVSGLEEAIKRIAAKEPWLIKKKDDGTQQTQQTTQTTTTQRGSGAPPLGTGGGKASVDAKRREELMKRFPVLGSATR